MPPRLAPPCWRAQAPPVRSVSPVVPMSPMMNTSLSSRSSAPTLGMPSSFGVWGWEGRRVRE
uniref:Uncharacterized protein n=1 Tax=Oryza nivara TaxID=4536 RepID=A0A0E0HJW7_ORYNI